MGRRGPAPEPTSKKIARGETRPSRINRQEPLPRDGRPRMPADMTPGAKAAWRAVLEAAPVALITPFDAYLLRSYCEAVDLYRQAIAALAKSGPLVRGARGNELVVNPLHRVMRDNRDAMRLLGRELGISPAARSGMSVGIGGTGTVTPDLDDDIGLPRRLRLVSGDA